MKGVGIKLKVMLLGILPALTVAVLLGVIFVSTQYEELEKALEKRGIIVTSQLAQASEYGVQTGDRQLLLSLIQHIVTSRDTVYVAITDATGEILAQSGTPVAEQSYTGDLKQQYFVRSVSGDELVFHAPVYRTRLVVSDEDELLQESLPRYVRSDVIIGYASVAMSTRPTNQRQQELLMNSVLLVLSVLLLTGLVATLIGRAVSNPIVKMTEAVRRMERGDLDARVQVDTRDELSYLADGFNSMGQALKSSQQHLQEKIDDATRQLRHAFGELEQKNAELDKQRLHALEANRAKSQFLANMSHELRTPLNAIIGYSEMLQEDVRDQVYDDLEVDLGKIHKAGNHLLTLINDVLDLSKIEAGKMELHLEHFDIKPVIQDIAATLRPLVNRNNNILVLDCPDDLGAMYSDIIKLRQAIMNLVGNAAKFTRDGRIELKIRRKLLDGKAWLHFSISDNGIGMSEQQLNNLFRPFTQADASTTRRYGGTGLGLAITQHYCQMMGGDIAVTSTPDVGSSFTIQIPATAVAPPDSRPELTQDHFGQQGVSRIVDEVAGHEICLQEAKVLCIDDDPAVRELLERYLTNAGCRFVGADSGEKGLLAARQSRPDLILLDIMMPAMDGWTVLHELKSEPGLADIPVIIISMVDEDQKTFALGASDFVSKPVDWGRLSRVMRRHIGSDAGKPVLIVDDDQAVREVLQQQLRKEGWPVILAENGEQALQHLQKQQPAMILLDLMMPEMDGFEFIHHFRQHPEWQSIPVVILTAADLSYDQMRRLRGSVERIVQKQSRETADLLRQVGQYMNQLSRRE